MNTYSGTGTTTGGTFTLPQGCTTVSVNALNVAYDLTYEYTLLFKEFNSRLVELVYNTYCTHILDPKAIIKVLTIRLYKLDELTKIMYDNDT